MTILFSIGLTGLTWGVVRALRRRYHDRLTAAYCEGFRDGVAYETKVGAEQGKRVVLLTAMSLN